MRADLRELLFKHVQLGKTQMKPWPALSIGIMESQLVGQGLTDSRQARVYLHEAKAKAGSNTELTQACDIALGLLPELKSIPAEEALVRSRASFEKWIGRLEDPELRLVERVQAAHQLDRFGHRRGLTWRTSYSVGLQYIELPSSLRHHLQTYCNLED